MEAIKKAREAKGITLRQLSELTGIDNANLSNIERGKIDPRFSTLTKICDSLGLKIEITPKDINK